MIATESLGLVFDKYGCDKGSRRHNYERLYEPLFSDFRLESVNLLEIGILGGASVMSYLEYFPKAKIYGIDTFERIPESMIPVLRHERVVCLKGDSTSDQFTLLPDMDIIIDDGRHTHAAQRATFVNLFPRLKRGGIYLIEDVWPFALMSETEKAHPWLKTSEEWSDYEYQKLLTALTPYSPTFHDLRKGHYEDTFVIEVRKK